MCAQLFENSSIPKWCCFQINQSTAHRHTHRWYDRVYQKNKFMMFSRLCDRFIFLFTLQIPMNRRKRPSDYKSTCPNHISRFDHLKKLIYYTFNVCVDHNCKFFFLYTHFVPSSYFIFWLWVIQVKRLCWLMRWKWINGFSPMRGITIELVVYMLFFFSVRVGRILRMANLLHYSFVIA